MRLLSPVRVLSPRRPAANRLVLPTSEIKVVGPLTFHDLALIIAGSSTIIAVFHSFYLIVMHGLHYTKPNEQRQYVPSCLTCLVCLAATPSDTL